LCAILALAVLGGCTVHPDGEKEERQAALSAEPKPQMEFPANPTREDLVRFALLNNAEVEQDYCQWRSAIEQVPIDGTQATNLTLSLGTVLDEGKFARDRTTVSAANDPMTDIVLPPKLSTAAQRSLENARAAGVRFRKAQFELRRKVLSAYDDYALSSELVRLSQRDILLLKTTADITAARSQAGMAGQQDLLKARNELDLQQNDLESMQSQLPIQRAMLNALLNRPATADIPLPDHLPAPTPLNISDQDLLDQAAKTNPELTAMADEIRAKHEEIQLAKLQYYPDFSVSAGTDLAGMAQSLLGSVTVPILRYEALHAAVEQAQANLNAAEATRQQTQNDLAAQLIDDISTLRDADRQIALLQNTILPRARQAVDLARSSYQAGNASFLDLLDSQRTLIDLERLIANLNATRDKRMVEIESITAQNLPE
jgi:outer membrane protein TolC